MEPVHWIVIILSWGVVSFLFGTFLEHRDMFLHLDYHRTQAKNAYFLAFHGWKPDSTHVNEWTDWIAPDLQQKWDMDDAVKRQKLLNKANYLRVAPELLEKPAEVAVRTYTPEGWR